MKTIKQALSIIFFIMLCFPLQAQVVNRINRSVQNAAERAAERAVTKKAEKEVTKAIDKGFEAAEKGVQAAEKENQKAANNNQKTTPEPYTGPVKSAPKEDTKFPFEHGSYVEVIEAFGIEAQRSVFFSHFGEWMAIEDKSEIEMFGMKVKNNKLQITKGDKHWDLDFDSNTGTYYEGNSQEDDSSAMITNALKGDIQEGLEIIDLGQEVYLGYTCKKTQVKYALQTIDLVCLSYGTLLMKSEGKAGPFNMATRIISLDLNAPPSSKFEVPAGFTIE